MADSNTIAITIELPQIARTFSITVAPGATIRDVKDAVSQECEGRPRAEGQRLIAKGRVLRDEERVEELWLVCSFAFLTSCIRLDSLILLLVSVVEPFCALNSAFRTKMHMFYIWLLVHGHGQWDVLPLQHLQHLLLA